MAFKIATQKSSDRSSTRPKDKRQQLLLIALAVMVVVIVIALYFGVFRAPKSTPTDTNGDSIPDLTPYEQETEAAQTIDEINFDVDFLKTPLFQDLKFYGDESLRVDEKGRDHPFLPF